ncbi:hypothetical protein QQS21_012589 [Conoideocrella luteorostrata]|uniref:Kynurenine formamidase n=1 Tax=Conoideocrella luteorostrata TaxID=1105319 RepID=A0AAJ0CDM5_9HYPO|nr:hypothetical protein QQS21_012589 [Conoideocrella luteorostrata]
MSSAACTNNLRYSTHQYGDHALQCVGVWQHAARAKRLENRTGYWIIFIHGGAWLDPRNTLEDFIPSIRKMMSSRYMQSSAIRAFASIDYRLSPSRAFPQDPITTPNPELRAARHPDHIMDVHAALKMLQEEYELSNNYILVGHSAGATLAFQLLMGETVLYHQHRPPSILLPVAIIAVSGIYDLVGLEERHRGEYTRFIQGAFGHNKETWARVSPATFSGNFMECWNQGIRAILAHSPDDSLIDHVEIDAMSAKLARDGVEVSTIRDLTGDHDFVWQDGSQIAYLVFRLLGGLPTIP